MKAAYVIITFIIYILFALLVLHLKTKYKTKKQKLKKPVGDFEDVTATDISFILKNKITKRAFIARIMELLILKKAEVIFDKNNFIFKKKKLSKDVSKSDYFVLEIINQLDDIPYSECKKYIKQNKNATDFLIAYTFWKKEATKEVRKKGYFSPKNEYFLIKYLNYIIYTLVFVNFVYNFHILPAYLLIFCNLFIKFYFYKLSKLSEKGLEVLNSVNNIRKYLNESNLKDSKLKNYSPYIVLLELEEKLDDKQMYSKFIKETASLLMSLIKKANLVGSRNIFGFKNKY